MLESSLCTLLSQLSLIGAHMIIAGDPWQLEPIVPSAPLLDSDLLYCLAPVCIELNVCKRSDSRLHHFGLSCKSDPFEISLARAREIFCAQGLPDWYLCLDNFRRKQINVERNISEMPWDAVWVQGETDMWLFPGLRLMGCRIKPPVLNLSLIHI